MCYSVYYIHCTSPSVSKKKDNDGSGPGLDCIAGDLTAQTGTHKKASETAAFATLDFCMGAL